MTKRKSTQSKVSPDLLKRIEALIKDTKPDAQVRVKVQIKNLKGEDWEMEKEEFGNITLLISTYK